MFQVKVIISTKQSLILMILFMLIYLKNIENSATSLKEWTISIMIYGIGWLLLELQALIINGTVIGIMKEESLERQQISYLDLKSQHLTVKQNAGTILWQLIGTS